MGTGTHLQKVGCACVTGPNKPLQPVISSVFHRRLQGNARGELVLPQLVTADITESYARPCRANHTAGNTRET